MPSKVMIYSDGGARGNPGPAAIGVLICDDSGRDLLDYAEVIGETTNNVAEYRGLLKGLELAKEMGASQIDYYVDSQLVACQVRGEYRVKTPHILELFKQVKESLRQFESFSIRQVPRTHEKIQQADKLVNQALDEAGH